MMDRESNEHAALMASNPGPGSGVWSGAVGVTLLDQVPYRANAGDVAERTMGDEEQLVDGPLPGRSAKARRELDRNEPEPRDAWLGDERNPDAGRDRRELDAE
jgi:hypothetical protein